MKGGTYVEIGNLVPGDELMNHSPHISSNAVRVKSVHRQRLKPNQQQSDIVTIQAHACGDGVPHSGVIITRNHAIRCQVLADEYALSDSESLYAYTYPEELPSSYVTPGADNIIPQVCNVDLGDPDILMEVNGLLAESWDGHVLGEMRNSTFRQIRDTPLMERYLIIRQ